MNNYDAFVHFNLHTKFSIEKCLLNIVNMNVYLKFKLHQLK
jgi:hypothetical protein